MNFAVGKVRALTLSAQMESERAYFAFGLTVNKLKLI